jgi:pimeloyl-ACP methyl ester carboxylesterase
MSHQPLRNFIWMFSGFRQDYRNPCGLELVWRDLRTLSGERTAVQFSAWDLDPEGVAAFIDRNGIFKPNVLLIGYSWGGDKAVDVARELWKRGIDGVELILCDAVFRSSLFSTRLPLNPLSLTRLVQLKIPPGVQHVRWFYQRQNRPMGHRPIAEDPERTTIADGIELPLNHSQMDESEMFARACREAAEAMVV